MQFLAGESEFRPSLRVETISGAMTPPPLSNKDGAVSSVLVRGSNVARCTHVNVHLTASVSKRRSLQAYSQWTVFWLGDVDQHS